MLGTLQISRGSFGCGVGPWKVLVTERLLQIENQIMIVKAKARVCLLLIRRIWPTVFLLRRPTDSWAWLHGNSSIVHVTDQF